MKKKKSGGGGANWMDTYGDMVTLLLCFFVLLYSMSNISEEAWKNLVMSFNPNAVPTETETRGGGGPSADGDEQGVAPAPEKATQDAVDQDIENLYQAISQYISQASISESMSVSKDGGRVYVTFNGTTFFKGDSNALTEEALPVLDNMASMLSKVAYSIDEVRVIGHTAQYAADSPNDPWTDYNLSGGRAARVVAYLVNNTRNEVLDPAKFTLEGKGQWQPVASNDTAEGKAKNRRVEMVISGRDLEQELAESGGVQSYYTEGQGPSATAGPENPAAPDSSASPSRSPAAVES